MSTPDATLDAETIALLRRMDATSQPGIVLRLRDTFATTGLALVDGMRDALGSRDNAAFARHAHSLKGAAGAIGALRLRDACAEAERLVPSADASAALVRVASEFERARGALEHAFGG